MKTHIIDKIVKESDFLHYFLLLLLGLIYVSLSPSLFNQLQADSQSYINNDSIRPSLYPIIIDWLSNEIDSSFHVLLLFQRLFLVTSILCLIISLKSKGIKGYSSFFLYFFILSNFYYTSFCNTILTEAIFSSFINFSISLLIAKEFFFKHKLLSLVFGLLLGGIFYIKSIGIVITFLFFVIFVYQSFQLNKKNNILFFLFGFVSIILIERSGKPVSEEKNNSVFSRSLTGKIFMLSGTKEFDTSNFKKEFVDYLMVFNDESKKINSYLDSLSNPFLIASLKSDYETVGQYQFDNKFDSILDNHSEKYHYSLKKNLVSGIIKKYPFEYLKLSLWHYLGLWTPGGKHIFLNYNSNVPYQNMLKKSSGKILEIKKEILLIVCFFFTILLLLFTFFTIRGVYYFLKSPMGEDHTFTFLIITCQIYLALVCLTNVSTPRYLMPLFPIIIIIICISIKDLFNYFYKNKLRC